MKRRFERYHAPDDRDLRYLLAPPKTKRTKRVWATGPWHGDQVSTPACVGFAWAHFLHAQPVRQWLDPHGIYELAQHCDEWEGNNYDGTSVRGAAKVLAALGLVERYLWTFALDDLVDAVLELGPVVVGTNWYAGMSTPDAGGVMHVTGRLQGGHAWLIHGVDTRQEVFLAKNSWGEGWGRLGFALIGFDGAERLIAEDGEVCLAVERRAGPE